MFNKIINLFSKKKKNIILIALDGVRYDMFKDFDMFSNLRKKGTLFTNMTTYAPHSIASFHAIFTGLYGGNNGVNSYFGTLKFKKNEVTTLTQYMKNAGFYTIGDSMNELVIPEQGFDKLVIQEPFGEFVSSHKQLLKEVKEKNNEGKPCFCHLHCSHVHNDVVKEVIKKFDDMDDNYFNSKEDNRKRYNGFLDKVDTYLKEIMPLIEELGLDKNSRIIFFSDHGGSIGEKKGEKAYGNFCYDYSLKTFCLLIDNELFPVKKIDKLTRTVDIAPTIMEIENIKPDSTKIALDGKSLMEYIKSKTQIPRIAFSETGGIKGPWPSEKEPNVFAIRTDEWKLIKNPEKFELYNIKNDSNEENNLKFKNEDKFKELKMILEQNIQ